MSVLKRAFQQLNPVSIAEVNHVDRLQKHIFLESATSGADFEPAIVMGWYEVTETEFDLSKTGISQKDYNSVMENESLKVAGVNIAKLLIKQNSDIANQSFAYHFGRGSPKVTAEWSKYGAGKAAASRTPKTDLYIGKYNISLKIGAAQLMSGAREEALATFYNALEQTNLSNDPVVMECVNIIEQFTSGITNGKTAQHIKNKTDSAVVDADAVHKQTMEKLRVLFETNEKFKLAFVKEAMTGHIKFGRESRASADWFLVSDHNGSKVEFHSIDDDSYVQKVANSCSISVKMKSTSIKSKKAKPGDRKWWSALGLTTKDLSTSINEEVDLNEGISSILRKSINVVKQKFKVVVITAKKLIKKNFRAFLQYLGFDADIDFTMRF